MGDPSKPVRMAECHPERRHQGKGLCKQCYQVTWRAANRETERAGRRAWAKANPEKVRSTNKRRYAANPARAKAHCRRSRYGVSATRFCTLIQAQGGLCLVCHEECSYRSTLSVDHCHDTKKVRGLLCSRCNTAVGMLRNSPDIARAVAIYLEVCS